jgi:hypothetical protein
MDVILVKIIRRDRPLRWVVIMEPDFLKYLLHCIHYLSRRDRHDLRNDGFNCILREWEITFLALSRDPVYVQDVTNKCLGIMPSGMVPTTCACSAPWPVVNPMRTAISTCSSPGSRGEVYSTIPGWFKISQDLLGIKVHIGTEKSLHWYVRGRILREATPL